MLEDLTDNQILVLTELVIHQGMLRFPRTDYRYNIYYKIAGNLMDEVIKQDSKWTKLLIEEFLYSQMYYVKK